jgi:hypothetical protein
MYNKIKEIGLLQKTQSALEFFTKEIENFEISLEAYIIEKNRKQILDLNNSIMELRGFVQ